MHSTRTRTDATLFNVFAEEGDSVPEPGAPTGMVTEPEARLAPDSSKRYGALSKLQDKRMLDSYGLSAGMRLREGAAAAGADFQRPLNSELFEAP